MCVRTCVDILTHFVPPHPSRPARTWFQSEREKQAVKEGAKAAAEGRAPPSGSAQQQKAAKGDAKSKKREKLKEKRAAEAEAGKRDGGVLAETEEHTRRVKSIKSKTRELQLQGLPANKAAKIAAAAVTGARPRLPCAPRSGRGS
jgi:hypothetical protein